MTAIRTFIVDDEAPARNWLHDLCVQQADVEVIGQCGTASQAIQRLGKGGIDLLLLDIQLGPFSGFDVLHKVPPLRAPLVIFVTAFDRHAVRAFEENAVDYLLKPVSADRFAKAMERVRQHISRGLVADLYGKLSAALVPLQRAVNASREGYGLARIVAERDGAFHVIDVEAIELIESEANYVLIRIEEEPEPYRKRGTLQEIGTSLDAKQYLRIRRDCIVNLAHVSRIERGTVDFAVILKSGRRILVGRSYRRTLAEFIRTSRSATSLPSGKAAGS